MRNYLLHRPTWDSFVSPPHYLYRLVHRSDYLAVGFYLFVCELLLHLFSFFTGTWHGTTCQLAEIFSIGNSYILGITVSTTLQAKP